MNGPYFVKYLTLIYYLKVLLSCSLIFSYVCLTESVALSQVKLYCILYFEIYLQYETER